MHISKSFTLTVLTIILLTASLVARQDYDTVDVSDGNGNMVEMIRCATPGDDPGDTRAPENMAAWKAANGPMLESEITIPVAFHIITTSSGLGMVDYWQLEAQIDTMNTSFEGSGFNFHLFSVDTVANDNWYDGNDENGFKRALAVDPARVLNFYLAGLGGGLLGWAYLPWSFDESDPFHGVVVLNESLPGGNASPFNLGATGTHEVGHYLGLYHTFSGGCTPPGDEVEDTPFQQSPSSGCPQGRDSCPAPGEDPIHNYMDYSSDACMYEFTPGQADRMNWAVLTYKPSLLTGFTAPESPESFSAYSDYETPNSIEMQWLNPEHTLGGDTLDVGSYHIMIERDGVLIDSINDGSDSYIDGALEDGVDYSYRIYTRIDSNDVRSLPRQAGWIAGGAPTPNPPTDISAVGNTNEVSFFWTNPAKNIDGTPMDDFAGVRLFMDSVWVHTFERTAADTSMADSATYILDEPGYHYWYIAAVDNESEANLSTTSSEYLAPLQWPVIDYLTETGVPFFGYWTHFQAEIDDRAIDPPSAPYTINLNGNINGRDVLELRPLDLSEASGSGLVLSYHYQPQGSGAAPSENDSLRLYIKNELGDWLRIRGYGGTEVQPFVEERIDLDTLMLSAGTVFHDSFQFRLSVKGNPHPFQPVDDWFVDNLFFGTPRPHIAAETDSLYMPPVIAGNTTTASFEIQNVGLSFFEVTNVISTNPVFSVSQSAFSLTGGTHGDLVVEFSPTQTGMETGWLHILHTAPNADTISVYVSGEASLVGIELPEGVPATYEVSPNYPNPFNPSTLIQYQLPSSSTVELNVYNMLGQRVRTLVNDRKNAGYHQVVWDGRNELGQQVASGIYIYRFVASNGADKFQKTRKMILLK